MNGVHDLGGTDGLGRVEVPDSEPVFRAEWEKAAFAMFSMCFKEPAYRARIVKEPRRVLREDFGYDVSESVEVRVWDSSSEMLLGAAQAPGRDRRAQ